MAGYRTLLIRLEKARVNMLLAHDVLDGSGNVIIAKDTMLTDRLINMLRGYHVDSIPIKVDIEDGDDVKLETELELEPESKHRTELKEKSAPEPIAQSDEASPDTHNLDFLAGYDGDPTDLKLNVNTEDFNRFERSYDDKVEKTRDIFAEMEIGVSVDVRKLYEVNTEIMDTLKHRNDLFLYMNSLEIADDYLYTHSVNVSLLCYLFGYWLSFSEERATSLAIAGMLHDIGKTRIPLEIMNKKDSHTPEEQEIVREHPRLGFDMVRKFPISQDAKMAVLSHHERFDGSGYPMGVRGNQINEFSRIIAIADIYEAMTADRTYRRRICPFEVIRELQENCYGLLDPQLLLTFTKNIAYSYIGTYVRLTNGDVGVVMLINPTDLTRPTVRTNKDVIDLSSHRDISVAEVL